MSVADGGSAGFSNKNNVVACASRRAIPVPPAPDGEDTKMDLRPSLH